MTPEEAKTKWCPFFRNKGPVDQWSDNRDHGGAGFCIGPACMAWRWSGDPPRCRTLRPEGLLPHGADEPPRPSGLPASWEWTSTEEDLAPCWREPVAEADGRRPGYCGLAGKDGAP